MWPELLPELAERIASFLDTNDVAFGLRLVNKAVAVQFRGPQHTTIRLSQPVPHHVFVAKWAAPGAMRSFPLRRRRQLLCLMAASGSIPNLEVAVSAASCRLTAEVMAAAAAAGKLDICQWLHQHGCPWRDALQQAARNGHKDVCVWLLEKGCPWCWEAVAHAAQGGHVGLVEWLLQQKPRRARGDSNLIHTLSAEVHGTLSALHAVAGGCDLPTLQRLFPELTPVLELVLPAWKGDVLAGAAASSTPDWAAKVEWLEGQGCPRTRAATMAAAARPQGAVERLAWLLERGYPLGAEAGPAAAETGNVAVLKRLQAEGIDFDDLVDDDEDGSTVKTMAQAAATRAARAGHLAFLQALHRVHRSLDAFEPAEAAASEGHLHVVAWLVDEAGQAGWDTRQLLGPELIKAAARSGSVELMAWLRERGCGWDAGAFTAAAEGGCEEASEWLVERGCPMADDGEPYLAACDNGDLATLRCLHHLGCPWGPAGCVLSRAVDVGWPPVLRWLREEGCPTVPNLLPALARGAQSRGQAEVADLLEGWQRMHQSDTCG